MEEGSVDNQENDVNFLYNKTEETNGFKSYEAYSTEDLEELLEDETPASESVTDVASVVPETTDEPGTNASKETDAKPRIILTFRTSDAHPDAYFSTSSIQQKIDGNQEKKDVHKVKDNLIETATVELSNKRNLRRMSNSKESVLQNAIALKEKSFGLPETSYKKKSPKCADKTPKSLKMKSPKSLITSYFQERPKISELPDGKEITITPVLEDADISVNSVASEPTIKLENFSEMEMNSSFSNCLQTDDSFQSNKSASYDKNLKPKKRKRYFKGLSYSFNNKKHAKKKRTQSDRRGNKYEISESSEQDTDSQNTIINSGEMCENGECLAWEIFCNFFRY